VGRNPGCNSFGNGGRGGQRGRVEEAKKLKMFPGWGGRWNRLGKRKAVRKKAIDTFGWTNFREGTRFAILG